MAKLIIEFNEYAASVLTNEQWADLLNYFSEDLHMFFKDKDYSMELTEETNGEARN